MFAFDFAVPQGAVVDWVCFAKMPQINQRKGMIGGNSAEIVGNWRTTGEMNQQWRRTISCRSIDTEIMTLSPVKSVIGGFIE